MNSFMTGLLIGTSIGFSVLVCPQVRDFMDKIENKIAKRKEKHQEKAEE